MTDLRKPFDTVNQEILSLKLYRDGIWGTAHKLNTQNKDYVANRQ